MGDVQAEARCKPQSSVKWGQQHSAGAAKLVLHTHSKGRKSAGPGALVQALVPTHAAGLLPPLSRPRPARAPITTSSSEMRLGRGRLGGRGATSSSSSDSVRSTKSAMLAGAGSAPCTGRGLPPPSMRAQGAYVPEPKAACQLEKPGRLAGAAPVGGQRGRARRAPLPSRGLPNPPTASPPLSCPYCSHSRPTPPLLVLAGCTEGLMISLGLAGTEAHAASSERQELAASHA